MGRNFGRAWFLALAAAVLILTGCGTGGDDGPKVFAGDRLVFVVETTPGTQISAMATAQVSGTTAVTFNGMAMPTGTQLDSTYAAEGHLISDVLTEAQANTINNLDERAMVLMTLQLKAVGGNVKMDSGGNARGKFAIWRVTPAGATITTTDLIDAEIRITPV